MPFLPIISLAVKLQQLQMVRSSTYNKFFEGRTTMVAVIVSMRQFSKNWRPDPIY